MWRKGGRGVGQQYDQGTDTGDEIVSRRRERGIPSYSRREWHSSRVPTFFPLLLPPFPPLFRQPRHGASARFSREVVHNVTRETSGWPSGQGLARSLEIAKYSLKGNFRGVINNNNSPVNCYS